MSDPSASRSAPDSGAAPPIFDQPLFDRLRSGIAVLAADGTWLQANPALGCLLRVDPATLAGGPAHRTALAPVAAEIDAAVARIADGGDGLQLLPVTVSTEDGGDRHLQLDLQPLPAGRADGATRLLLQLHDVTAQHELERQQETLAFGISHELRAPVRAVEQFSRRLIAQGGGDAVAQEHLQRISGAAVNAGGLIDALLEYMRAGKSSRPARAVDISLLGAWVCAELQDAEPARAADIAIAPDLWALGDEHAIKQMLGKLLHNAWKFSSQRERVSIAIDGEAVDGRMRLTIRDAGRGFDMRYAGKLFAPFRRLHSADDGGGHGLGLVIAQRLAHAQGGRIRVQSEQGIGSTFFIDLPAVPDEGVPQQ
ncbi:PAS domain-containing protein [Luteimonas sp. BDR2-5]|uniref:sensor histidine kinase n=1 Tax=Proluteimonas luteida TaxID=2878685 RepID=UPI001E34D0A2|nr:ATP-binding protein [Luteimonas sp. BDR2-5]MCD9027947.1 PAS domain-containing protein [Luteimonas sp. BDR2-5]